MNYVYLTLNWVFGILFCLMGLMSLFGSVYVGLCYIAMSLLLLPPVRKAAFEKTNKEISTKNRAISIFFLLILSGIFLVNSTEKQAAELAAKQAEEKGKEQARILQENIKYFKDHKEQIVSEIQKSISEKNYQAAINQANKYIAANDADLKNLNDHAKSEIENVKREEKTKSILESIKKTKDSEYKANKNLYQQLVSLNPENKTYKEKLDFYSEKLSSQEEKERKEQEKIKKESEMRIAKFGNPPTQSSWDGSYFPVEQYLKEVANDPDSIKISGCTGVYHTENGWLVGCDYRGKNAFGGMIKQSNWFTISHDRVIKMHEASAYSP